MYGQSLRQVFLGRKKEKTGDKSGKLYAIKTMKKTELVKKNMIDQGQNGNRPNLNAFLNTKNI